MHASDLLGCVQGTCGAHGMTGCVHLCLCMCVSVHLSVWGRGGKRERKGEERTGEDRTGEERIYRRMCWFADCNVS